MKQPKNKYGEIDPVKALGRWLDLKITKAAGMNVFGPLTAKEQGQVLCDVKQSLKKLSRRNYRKYFFKLKTGKRGGTFKRDYEYLGDSIGEKQNGELKYHLMKGGD